MNMKNKYLTKNQVIAGFVESYFDLLNKWDAVPKDIPAKQEAWNNFVDFLKKAGDVNPASNWCQPKFISR